MISRAYGYKSCLQKLENMNEFRDEVTKYKIDQSHKLKNLQMKSSYYEVKGFLDALEMSLHGKTKYIFGENPTIADFISYVIISRIYLISQNKHLLGARTLKYWDRLLKIQDLN